MKQENFVKGRLGEQIARNFLEEKGYKHIESNFYVRGGEIDLIMNDGQSLVFIEVKLKTGDEFGSPEEMINTGKIGNIRKTAWLFLMERPILAKTYTKLRIDTVCIVMKDKKEISKIKHYQNISI